MSEIATITNSHLTDTRNNEQKIYDNLLEQKNNQEKLPRNKISTVISTVNLNLFERMLNNSDPLVWLINSNNLPIYNDINYPPPNTTHNRFFQRIKNYQTYNIVNLAKRKLIITGALYYFDSVFYTPSNFSVEYYLVLTTVSNNINSQTITYKYKEISLGFMTHTTTNNTPVINFDATFDIDDTTFLLNDANYSVYFGIKGAGLTSGQKIYLNNISLRLINNLTIIAQLTGDQII